MDIRSYQRNEVIFREGDPGDCMYDIQFGKVGIFHHYGKADEKKIAELMPDQIFGEMGLLDAAPRSATAVALSNDTMIEVVSEEAFYDYFEKNPPKVLDLMQQMCNRLRRTTKNYLEACETVHESLNTEKTGEPKTNKLLESIRKFCDLYKENFIV